MSEQSKPIVNIADLPLRSSEDGKKFTAQFGEIGMTLGFYRLGARLHIVPAGKAAFPFHRHHGCDEMFFVPSGSTEYRLGEERLRIRAGDGLGAPARGAAHQIINTGTNDLRYIGFSNIEDADLVERSESGMVSVEIGVKGNHYTSATSAERGRLESADYWAGEEE